MTYFTAITIITILFLVAGGVSVSSNRTVRPKARAAFLSAIVLIGLEAGITWFNVNLIVEGHMTDLFLFTAIFMSVTFSVMPAIPVIISNTILPSPHVRWFAVALAAHAAFELLNPLTGLVFYIDEKGLFQSGPLYGLYTLVYCLAVGYLVYTSVRVARTFQSVNVLSTVAILVCMASGVVIQVVHQRVYVTWLSVAMGMVLYFQFYSDMILRTDSLTRLLNRHAYSEFLVAPETPCIVALIDIDNFKYVNDTYGHSYGDKCLSTLASLILAAFGSYGRCYRTGGDEFTVVVTRHLDRFPKMCDELRRLVEESRKTDGRIPYVSVGHALAQGPDADIDQMLREADAAMYQNKRDAKARRRGGDAR